MIRLRTTLVLAVLLTPAVSAAAAEGASATAEKSFCEMCHGEDAIWEGDTRRFCVAPKHFGKDVHWQEGLRCHDCHGGDQTTADFAAAHSVDAGFRSVKSPADVPGFCGHCHSNNEYMRDFQPSARTDQESEYWTSGHGKRLKENDDPDVATCVSCHGKPHGSGDTTGVKGILAVDDLDSPVYPTNVAKTCAACHADAKLMDDRTYHGRPIGHDQYKKWLASVHANALLERGDLSAPTCNDCHGNHGALPPNVESVANACGTCHGKVAELFSQTQMKHSFEQVGLPGCATCHGAHEIRQPSDQMLGMSDAAVCARCHAGGKYGATLAGAETAKKMRADLDRLKQEIEQAKAMVAKAERLGMEVSGPRFDLHNADNALVNARTLVHTFSPEPVDKALQEGFAVTGEVQKLAEKAMEEYSFRRVWLAASLVPIALVIVLLLLYIRSLPRPS